ncbi:unnamed protein product [Lathyrus sativus]|nr:unnamed protein product [Lathyrus sativus]
MFGTSFDSDRASRTRAEQLAAVTSARLQEATKAIHASNEIAQKAFIMQKLDTTNGQSASVAIRSSNRHYDDDLDDQSLSED